MSDSRTELRDLVRRVLSEWTPPDWATESGMDRTLWQTFAELDLLGVGRSKVEGGVGGDLEDAAAIIRECGRFATPLPIVEHLLIAPWLRREAGLQPSPAVTAVAIGTEVNISNEPRNSRRAVGVTSSCTWLPEAESLLVVIPTEDGAIVLEIASPELDLAVEQSVSGEPAARTLVDVLLGSAILHQISTSSWAELEARVATGTSLLLAGALERVLELCVSYSQEREQFGRPLAAFQSVRQQVAILAGEALLVGTAADSAAAAVMSASPHMSLAAFSARVRGARAATTAASIAHQVHGAIGFTREHQLHRYTRRLWGWRDEFGTEGEWEMKLGNLSRQYGSAGLWPGVTDS